MISLRKAAALSAVSALSLVGFSGIASAQSQSQITINVKVGEPRPAGVTGYNITTTCENLFGNGGFQSTTTSVAAAGGTGNQFYTLTAQSNCIVTVTAVGGAATGAFTTINVGGSARKSGGLSLATDKVAINAATTIDINIAYPSIKVKKVVVGEEITPGTEYKMGVACYYSEREATDSNKIFAGSTTFSLKAGAEKTVSVADIPGLTAGAICHVAELSTGGAATTTINATKADGTSAGSIGLPGFALLNTGSVEQYTFSYTDGSNPDPSTRWTAGGATTGIFYIPAVQAVAGSATVVAVPFSPAVVSNNPFSLGKVFVVNPVAAAPGVAPLNGQAVRFASGGFTADGQTATVTNGFVGDLIVSKVVTGDPKSNIAVYEINVSCNAGGPRESFLLKDRQSKVFTGIPTGASCLVSETRSDGATASYSDNSGDNTTDGRVTIKGTASGCIDKNLTSFPDCRANVIITNSYVVATTTAAPTTAAPVVTAAPTTAAPVAEAPVEEPAELAEEEETVG